MLDVVLEDSGVGEEERRVPTEEHQSGKALRLGVTGHVVVAVQAIDPPQHRVVRAPRPLDEAEQREAHGDENAGDDTGQRDAEEADHRQHELRPAEVIERADTGNLNQAQCRGDHDGREGGRGQVLDQAGEGDQQHDDRARADQARHLGLRTRPPPLPGCATSCC